MFYKYFLSVNDESYDTILAGKCQFAHPQKLDRLKKLILNDTLKPIEDNCESGNIETPDAVSLKELTLKLYDHLYAHYYEMINGGVNSMVNDVLELESDKIIARIRAEFADELEQTKEQLEEAREETEQAKAEAEKTKEIIRQLRAGKEIAEVADELQISTDKVNEIAELLK